MDLQPLEPNDLLARRLSAGDRAGGTAGHRQPTPRSAPIASAPCGRHRRSRHRPRVQVAGDPDPVERQLRAARPPSRSPWPRSSAARTGSRAAGRAGPAASRGSPRASAGRPRCSGTRRAASACTGDAAPEHLRRPGPSSATRPAYMMSTRSHVSAMTDRSWVIRISDSPSSCRSRSSSSRIWAWTMTSSAVVGSSPMTIAGIARERHRDHRPLAHPARQLVGVRAPARPRDADQLEQLAGPLSGGLRGHRRAAPRSARRSGRGSGGPG